jgi:hypothetical protein
MILVSNSSPWQSELELQRERAWGYFQQIIDKNFKGSDRPLGQLERSLIQCCVAIERLVAEDVQLARLFERSFELALYRVTGAERALEFAPALSDRPIFLKTKQVSGGEIARRIYRLSHLAVVANDPEVPDGMLLPEGLDCCTDHLLIPMDIFLKSTDVIAD